MSKFLTPRLTRGVAGLAVLSAFVVAPVAAQAADTTATGTLTGGSLTNTAPTITAFGATLTGVNQTVTTDVAGWNINDATGSGKGYSVTVSATAPTVGGLAANAGTGGTMTLATGAATAASGNSATVAPETKAASHVLTSSAFTLVDALPGAGEGQWDFAAAADNLSVVVPGDASAGAYSSTLTYTSASKV